MSETSNLHEALERLKAILLGTIGAELTDTDVAELAGLEEEECRNLLGALLEAGAVEERRRRVFVCRPPEFLATPPSF